MSIRRCPNCSTANLKVIDSRPNKVANNCYRRYRCECGHRFSTLETILPEASTAAEMKSKHAVDRFIEKVLGV